MQRDPYQRVNAPAIGLLIAGAVSGVASLLWLIMLLFFSALIFADPDSRDALVGIWFWVPFTLLRLALDGLVIFGGFNMWRLQRWNMSMAGAIASSVPCSVCCFVTIPLGVWAIVTLLNEEVKQAFKTRAAEPPR